MARIVESASNVLGILVVSDDGLTIGVANLGVGLVAVGVRPWTPAKGLAGEYVMDLGGKYVLGILGMSIVGIGTVSNLCMAFIGVRSRPRAADAVVNLLLYDRALGKTYSLSCWCT